MVRIYKLAVLQSSDCSWRSHVTSDGPPPEKYSQGCESGQLKRAIHLHLGHDARPNLTLLSTVERPDLALAQLVEKANAFGRGNAAVAGRLHGGVESPLYIS
jgi:hypothetical protein